MAVAMEPGLGGQEKHPALAPLPQRLLVAMEPGLGGQEKLAAWGVLVPAAQSQWSLALAARKRARDFLLV